VSEYKNFAIRHRQVKYALYLIIEKRPTAGRFSAQDVHWYPENMIFGYKPMPLGEASMLPDILTIQQGRNSYTYALNNPINYLDPDGEIILTALAIVAVVKVVKVVATACVIGFAVGAGADVVSQAVSAEGSLTERFQQIDRAQVLISGASGAVAGGLTAVGVPAPAAFGVAAADGAFNTNYVGEMFSPNDREIARKSGLPMFLTTPLGYLRRYDASSFSSRFSRWLEDQHDISRGASRGTVVARGLPADKNASGFKCRNEC